MYYKHKKKIRFILLYIVYFCVGTYYIIFYLTMYKRAIVNNNTSGLKKKYMYKVMFAVYNRITKPHNNSRTMSLQVLT